MSQFIWKREKGNLTKITRATWEKTLSEIPKNTEAELAFMSSEHHLVRNFIVRELPKIKKPLSPEFISEKLRLPVELVKDILDEFEKNLTFLFRNKQGSVVWAYPVTLDKTPHYATFSTGENLYAA